MFETPFTLATSHQMFFSYKLYMLYFRSIFCAVKGFLIRSRIFQEREDLYWIGPQDSELLWGLQKDWHIFMRTVSRRRVYICPSLSLCVYLPLIVEKAGMKSYRIENILFAGHPKIIHRDIKASNILLDFSFEAKVRVLWAGLKNYYT